MGFYGNITNTIASGGFSFDKIYSSRVAMMDSITTDDIYVGRFVLVDYDSQDNTRFNRVYVKNNKFYLDSQHKTLALPTTNVGEIVYQGDSVATYYICAQDENGEKYFREISKEDPNIFTLNYSLDRARYGNDMGQFGRGYDSTVWQKTYANGEPTFVMIAQLNSVVPTFDIQADPPTAIPTPPHFDANSNDVYYKIHTQPNWGLRVARAETAQKSDANVYWPTLDKNTHDINMGEEIPGAIYFNHDGFSASKRSEVADNNNYISILPTGSSGYIYSATNKTEKDIYEVKINLPAIGNMMCEGLDIIHGPNRDNDKANSLQGRLDSLKSLGENQMLVTNKTGGFMSTSPEGDKWISAEIKDGKLKVTHNKPTASSSGSAIKMIDFGDGFISTNCSKDDAGHITSMQTVSYTFNGSTSKLKITGSENANLDNKSLNDAFKYTLSKIDTLESKLNTLGSNLSILESNLNTLENKIQTDNSLNGKVKTLFDKLKENNPGLNLDFLDEE